MPPIGKTAKSRSGCRTCKQRRVKCNEARPSCKQCTSKNLECPGYVLCWKWSTKHERHPHPSFRKKNACNEERLARRDVVKDTASDGSLVIPSCDFEARRAVDEEALNASAHDSHFLSASPQIDQVSEVPRAFIDEAEGQFLLPSTHEPTSPESSGWFQPIAPDRPSRIFRQPLWPPMETVLKNPQVQVDFFTQKICKVWTAFNSDYDQFRTVSTSRVKKSVLFFSLCRYITAAFLDSGTPSTSSAILVQDAQTEMLQRLQQEVAQLDMSVNEKVEDVLMVVILFGLTANWDGSNSLGIFHYNAAVRLYRHTFGKANSNSHQSDKQEFFLQSLIYWWMGLAFITDTTEQCLLEPPISESEAALRNRSPQECKLVPHPLTGVSPESQRLLGKVGCLLYEQRLRSQKKSFTRLTRLQKDYDALQEARKIEEEALSMGILRADSFVDIADPNTPIQDLINMAEVYCLSSLILLYRAFPDLLDVRLKLDKDTANSKNSAKRNDFWLTALAIHALGILSRNAQHSGTRSIEQILLIIIAGELRSTAASTTVQTCNEEDASSGSSIGSLLARTTLSASTITDSSDQFITISGCSPQEVLWPGLDSSSCEASEPQCVAKARATVLTRLRAIREILPYRSLGMVEKLVLATWELSDHDDPEVFWMDIMIEKGWKLLLV